ncbi:MAG: hypothetical protein IPQ07_14020 [Myxococcales bacterium]|nr:hypothetical protein [Myxococcales bacterium]
MRIALVMLAVGGCWSSTPSSPPEPVHNTALAGPLEQEPVPQHSVWRGKYVCRQGVTALELTIDVASSGDANAIFSFGPHEANPNIPSGSYRMTGTVHESGPKLQVRLAPDSWLDQPENYMMVGINADSDRTRHRLTGWITDEGCSGVELRRIR